MLMRALLKSSFGWETLQVERLEKELLFYRSEFVEIEKRNDTLESMREDFLKVWPHFFCIIRPIA